MQELASNCYFMINFDAENYEESVNCCKNMMRYVLGKRLRCENPMHASELKNDVLNICSKNK